MDCNVRSSKAGFGILGVNGYFCNVVTNYRLHKIKDIRKVLAMAVLLLLIFSITPKKTLHNFFGCHQDPTMPGSDKHGANVVTFSFHCSCGQLDFQTPYTSAIFLLEPLLNVQHAIALTGQNTMAFENVVTSAYLRGPPTTL